MLFDVKQFEQFFKERPLKKGLKLFEKGELEFVERMAGFEYYFLVEGKKLHLKKKGDKLINYTCSCVKTDYCEHLSAALFYFQQEALGISVKSKKSEKKISTKVKLNSQTEENLKKLENESLVRFIREHKETLSGSEILSFLSDKSTITLFDVYCFQLEILLDPFLHLKKLDQQAIHSIEKSISAFIKISKAQIKKEDDFLYLDLALVCAFIPLFNLRFAGDEKKLFAIYRMALEKLELAYNMGLKALQKQAWLKATLHSVQSNKNLHSEAFLFFIPRCVTITKNEADLFLLNDTLRKRAYKIPYSSYFDKLLIVRFEVALKEWKLFETAFPLHQEGTEVELIIAKAELDFCNGKIDKAFFLLEAEYENVRTLYKRYYNDYLAYIFSKAAKFTRTEIEIKYLRESFVRNLFILPKELDRYVELLPAQQREQAMQNLISEIKTNTNGYYFDKISILLLKANLLDELTRELSKQNNKFSLMHEIAIKKFPDYTPAFLTLYMRHLAETLRQDSIYSYQVKLFNTAKIFLDQLPEKLVIELIKKLLDQIGKTGHLYRYINEMYDYPFLKEEENY